MKTGLDLFEKLWPKKLRGSRVGLLCHPASVNSRLDNAAPLFLRSGKVQLKALFGPQHGMHGETQDNMVEWKGFRDKHTGIPVYSLYSSTRKPEPYMLRDTDVMVVDVQDVGSRYYTFIWTMELCMQACAEMHMPVVVLDRPNPIGGVHTEGPVLDMHYSSFVGQRPLPVRHGMTAAEIAGFLKDTFYPSLDLHVIPMQGWERAMHYEEIGLPWVMPSPNMPAVETARVYPGMCLLEGTNLSEGRGTTRPFELFGAPFIRPDPMLKRLKECSLPGVAFRPLHFQPAFQKYAGSLCGGAQLHITNRNTFRPFRTGVAVIKAVHDLYPEYFQWKKPPYEYERKNLPIDILAGTDRLRSDIEKGTSLEHMEAWWKEQCREFGRKVRKRFLLYK
jgi:uncharacterized protein YbbC (DUF1343 family)